MGPDVWKIVKSVRIHAALLIPAQHLLRRGFQKGLLLACYALLVDMLVDPGNALPRMDALNPFTRGAAFSKPSVTSTPPVHAWRCAARCTIHMSGRVHDCHFFSFLFSSSGVGKKAGQISCSVGEPMFARRQ